jgi:ectoine hydroxylase-related dioxygenase (phytanoyl-CoA dioxygenase family)
MTGREAIGDDAGALPEPSVGAAMADLARLGYCVLEGVLNDAELAALRARADLIASQETAGGTAWYSHGNQRIFMLLNRGEEFVRLAGHPVALGVAERVLGPDLLLSSITANITQPGNEQQQLHADQQYVDEPWLCPMTVQAVWMLDDFTTGNGATRIVPGSHLWGKAPTGGAPTSAHLLGKAGSLGFIDGRVWHGTDTNITASQRRRGIFAYYCAPYLRQQENVFRSLHSDVRRALSPRMRKLLGYDIWYGLGTVDGLPREWLGTPQRSGPTNADGLFPR